MWAMQVFNVFNRVLGFFIRSKRIDFDDDWEERSELAGNGARLLRCAMSCPRTSLLQAPTMGQTCGLAPPSIIAVLNTISSSELPFNFQHRAAWRPRGRSIRLSQDFSVSASDLFIMRRATHCTRASQSTVCADAGRPIIGRQELENFRAGQPIGQTIIITSAAGSGDGLADGGAARGRGNQWWRPKEWQQVRQPASPQAARLPVPIRRNVPRRDGTV